jgi:hypothetical protein
MGLEKSLQFLEDAMDVMAQTKRPVEALLILTQTLRGSRRWREPQKKRKRIEGGGLVSKTFQFLEILAFIQW